MSMRDTEVVEFDAMLLSSKKSSFGKSGSGYLSLLAADVFAVLGGVVPAFWFVFVEFLDDTGVRDGGGAVVDPNLVAVGMVAVMVGVKSEADRFVRELFDLWESPHRPRKEN